MATWGQTKPITPRFKDAGKTTKDFLRNLSAKETDSETESELDAPLIHRKSRQKPVKAPGRHKRAANHVIAILHLVFKCIEFAVLMVSGFQESSLSMAPEHTKSFSLAKMANEKSSLKHTQQPILIGPNGTMGGTLHLMEQGIKVAPLARPDTP